MSSIETMQKGMEQAMERAAQADDRELAGRVREDGKRLIFLFNGLVRMSKLHDVDNEAFAKPAEDCSEIIDGLLELLGAVHIVLVEDQIYVNDIRLRIRHPEQASVELLIADMVRHEVGGLSVHQHLAPSVLKSMAILFAEAEAESRPRSTVLEKLGRPSALELTGLYRFRVGGEVSAQQKDIQGAIERGSSVLHEAVVNLSANRIPNPLPVRRAVIDLVEGMRADDAEAAVSSLRLRKGPVAERHLMAVCNLSVALAQRLGLNEGALSDLGVVAMLHDIGYSRRPDKVGHAAAGLRLLLRQRGFHEAKIRRMLTIVEHHHDYADASGSRPPSLFARIIRVVDDYDVLTTNRPGQPPCQSPATVLTKMWPQRGLAYDPTILAVFMRMMGQFPPGTLLELSDGRWGLSVSGARDDLSFAWPIVRIVREADGSWGEGTESFDLFEEKSWLRPLRVLDPTDSGEELESSLDRLFGDDPDGAVDGEAEEAGVGAGSETDGDQAAAESDADEAAAGAENEEAAADAGSEEAAVDADGEEAASDDETDAVEPGTERDEN